MHSKTEGIVLGVSKYSDTYSIVNIYTEEFGKISYLLPKRSGKKSVINSALFFPLSILSIDVEHLPTREIHRIKDAEMVQPFSDICTNYAKMTIAMFIAEFLSRVIKESEANPTIYSYLKCSIMILEKAQSGVANFPNFFLFDFMRYLGIYPNLDGYKPGYYFDLISAEFVENKPQHDAYLNKWVSIYLLKSNSMDLCDLHLVKSSKNDRSESIRCLLLYYKYHLCDLSDMKSVELLKEID